MPGRERSRASRVRERDEIIGGLCGLIALAALVEGRAYGSIHSTSLHTRLIAWVAAGALVIFGVLAAQHLAAASGHQLARRSSAQAGGVLRLLLTVTGFVVIVFGELAVLGVSATHLLIGAGVAGVVLGIAAQQSLANLFASFVLLLARPFRVGDHVRIRSGSIGTVDVEIVEHGLTYVTVRTADGLLQIPNATVLAAGIEHLTPSGAAD
jgi:small-conductance mechanosensitive channel